MGNILFISMAVNDCIKFNNYVKDNENIVDDTSKKERGKIPSNIANEILLDGEFDNISIESLEYSIYDDRKKNTFENKFKYVELKN
jgi:hypothetical protein